MDNKFGMGHFGSFAIFDYVTCEYPLPLPSDVKELEEVNWDEYIFIANKLDCHEEKVEQFEIGNNGFLYKRNILNEETGTYEINQQETTCEIIFFGLVEGEEIDYNLEFSSLFYKGELKEIKLLNFDKGKGEDREERRRIFEELDSRFKPKGDLSWTETYITEPIKYVFSLPFYLLFLVFHFVASILLRLIIWLK